MGPHFKCQLGPRASGPQTVYHTIWGPLGLDGPQIKGHWAPRASGGPNKVQTGLFEDHKAPGALAFGGPISRANGPQKYTIPYGAPWG